VFLEKSRAIQSAGMEDGLIDLIVIQLLVHMYKNRGPRGLQASEDSGNAGWIMFDTSKPWIWDSTWMSEQKD